MLQKPMLFVFIAVCLIASLLFFGRKGRTHRIWMLSIVITIFAVLILPKVLDWVGNPSIVMILYTVLMVLVVVGTLFVICVSNKKSLVTMEEPMIILPLMRHRFTGTIHRAIKARQEDQLFDQEIEETVIASEMDEVMETIAIDEVETIVSDEVETIASEEIEAIGVEQVEAIASEAPEVFVQADQETDTTAVAMPCEAVVQPMEMDVQYEAPSQAQPNHTQKHMQEIEWTKEYPASYLLPEETIDHVETSMPKPEDPIDILQETVVPTELTIDVDVVEEIPAVAILPQPLIATQASRMGEEALLDAAFALKWEGKWSEAADAFLEFRKGAQALWVCKQADLERLGALIYAERVHEAIDLIFTILDHGYDLSIEERNQIVGLLDQLKR